MTLTTVEVPEEMAPAFARAEAVVSEYFTECENDPSRGTIEVFGERYLLVRGASLSVEFFTLVKELFGEGQEVEAADFARNMLFDLAHAIGKSDAKNFHAKMGLQDPIERLSAGPVHFSHSGWAFVKVLPESRPSPGNDYYLIYDHPQSFEADTWIQKDLKADFPVCIMNAGYSSGWCQESFDVPLSATEIFCKARGDDCCRFIMAPPDRIEEHVERYMAAMPHFAQRMRTHTVPDFFSRKRLEEDLRRSESQYRGICEALEDGIFIVDADGVIVNLNPAAASLHGYSRQELVGLSAKTLVHPDHHRLFETFRATHATQGRFDAEALDVRKDGEQIHVEVHGVGFEYRGAPHLLAIVRDITERKNSEAKLADTNERLVEASRRAGMAEVATGVLHNVGNVLNSVNVSAEVMTERLKMSHVADLKKAVALMDTHAHDLATFITSDDRGRHLPAFLEQVTKELASERESLLEELRTLRRHVEHINEIVNVQQSFARPGGVMESIDLAEVAENALNVNKAGLSRHGVEVKRERNRSRAKN